MTIQPLYLQVKEHLLECMGNGQLRINDKVPSESRLAKELGVSRITVRRAVEDLVQAGYLTRVMGVGTFVTDRRAKADLVSIRDIAEELAASGHSHEMRIEAVHREWAGETLAERFETKLNTHLERIQVLHLRDGEPLLFEDRLVNLEVVPEFSDRSNDRTTCHALLMSIAPPEEAEHTIRAVGARPDVAALLEIEPGAPCLLVHRRTWARGSVVTIVDLHYAGDMFEISGRFKP